MARSAGRVAADASEARRFR